MAPLTPGNPMGTPKERVRVLVFAASPESAGALLSGIPWPDLDVDHERVDSVGALEAALSSRPWDILLTAPTAPGLTADALLQMVRTRAPATSIVRLDPDPGEGSEVLRGEPVEHGGPTDRVLAHVPSRRPVSTISAALEAEQSFAEGLLESVPVAVWQLDVRDAVHHKAYKPRAQSGTQPGARDAYAEAAARVRATPANDAARIQLAAANHAAAIFEEAWAEVLRALDEGEHAVRRELVLELGTARDIHLTARIGRNPRDLARVAVVLDDVTEEMRTQRAMMTGQRLEAVGRLATGIAHDFNNILMVLGSHATFVREELPAEHIGHEDLDAIEDGVKRATALVSQILAYSRRQPQDLEILDVGDAMRAAERMLRRILGEDIDFQTVLGQDPLRVRADRSQLDQVVVNLVVNARDAMPRGGRLLVETHSAQVRSEHLTLDGRAIPSGDYVVIVVEDTGCGMTAEIVERMFEPFFTTKPRAGTGLGLSTVFGIVEQSEGFITVETAPDMGTRFEIFLPRRGEAAQPRTSGTSAAPAPLRTGTVLLVEDSADVRAAAARVLRDRDFDVVEAATPDAAVREATRLGDRLDALVTDLVLPQRNGLELSRDVSALCRRAALVFTSGYSERAVLAEARQHPGAVFLQKPIRPSDLVEGVSRALRDRSDDGSG